MYGQRMQNFSVIDIEQIWKKHNGAPDIGKIQARKDPYMTKERRQELLERKHLAEIQMAAIQAMRDKENQEREDKNKTEG